MRGVDFAPGLVVQFLLFRRLDLALGEDNALFGDLGLERFQPRLEVSQVVAKPDAAHPAGRHEHATLAQFVTDADLAMGRVFDGVGDNRFFRFKIDPVLRVGKGADHVRYLVRLTELELIDRERRMVERRIRQARFPAVKSLDSFDFKAIASLNKMLVLELARCEYVERRENIIALGNSGTGKTHIALGLGLAACQKGLSVGFLTAAALVHELMEARDEKRLLRLQKQLAKYHLLIIDELGFVPLSKTGAELLFEVFSQRYERGSILVTSNLPFDEWTEIFGSERLTGALLDRLTHHVHILEMNGESYRLNQSQKRRKSPKIPA